MPDKIQYKTYPREVKNPETESDLQISYNGFCFHALIHKENDRSWSALIYPYCSPGETAVLQGADRADIALLIAEWIETFGMKIVETWWNSTMPPIDVPLDTAGGSPGEHPGPPPDDMERFPWGDQ